MEEIMNFPEKKNVGPEEFYLKKIFNPNHIQIGVARSKSYSGGIHDFEYDTKKERIKIFSRFRSSAFLIYGYLILPIIPLVRNHNNEHTYQFIGITIILSIFLTLILVLGIKSESKEIEREMIIRINYFRKNKR